MINSEPQAPAALSCSDAHDLRSPGVAAPSSGPGKLYTSFKILHHHQALKALAEGRRPAPVHARLKPTNICNHHCGYCTYGAGRPENRAANRDRVQKADQIPRDKMLEAIKDLAEMGTRALTFSGGGEPLTYPHMAQAAGLARELGLDLSLITNGQLLKGDMARLFSPAKWVRVSFDSPRPEEYAALRRIPKTAFDEVCANIAAFARQKMPDCVLGINFVVGRDNFNRIYEAAGLLKELGADNVKFSALMADQPGYHTDITEEALKQLERARRQLADDNFALVNAYQNEWNDKNFQPPDFVRCYTCEMAAVLGADQKLYLCHTRAYDSGAEIGDISNRSLREVWFAPETRAKIAALRPGRDCRNFCVYEERNQVLANYFDVNLAHVNFI